MQRRCQAKACQMLSVYHDFMCEKHWHMIPFDLQELIFDHYDRLKPNKTGMTAANRAIDIVFNKEYRMRKKDGFIYGF